MTNERSRAYGRVMKTIEDVGPAKLQPREADLIREAADALFFCEDIAGDQYARDLRAEARELAATLVDSERWLPETAQTLLGDLDACGPLLPVS
jgi:hypothetical protein